MNARNRLAALSVTSLVAAIALWATSPARPGRADGPKERPTPRDAGKATLALTGLDPVLLTQGKKAQGSEKITLVRDGLRYRFASEKNKAAFEKAPGRYGAQFQGNCALMPVVKANPELFAVHKGRIYLFGTKNCQTAFVADPDKHIKPRKNVAIFIHDGVELLDFAGPGEVFAAAGSGRAFRVYTVAAEPGPITSQGFLKVTPNYTFANCPNPDIVVLPGGATQLALKDDRLVKWVKKVAPGAEVTLSVCTGAFILGEAGLLDGKEATTHWASVEALRKRYPKTKVHANRRYVDNGKVVTAAGVSAGIDASLHVVERLLGKDAAKATARYMEYRRPEAAPARKDR